MNSLTGKGTAVFADIKDQHITDFPCPVGRMANTSLQFMTASKALMFGETFNLWKTLLKYRGQNSFEEKSMSNTS